MKVQVQQNDWTKENGKEKLWYAEDPVSKRIFFTSPMSPLPVGYVRRSTTNPKEMDRLFNRMHEQEREQNEAFVEKLYNQNRHVYGGLRSRLRERMVTAGVSDAEKNIIRACLRLMDEKDSHMQRNNVYGVSAMQEAPAPLPGPTTEVTVN
jgi:hypothetical protein